MSQRHTKPHRHGEVEPQRKIQRSVQKQVWSRQDKNDPLLLCSVLVCKKYLSSANLFGTQARPKECIKVLLSWIPRRDK